eukprot:m.75880 g.75880  ORF g.75880 m.75880 type:complete len:293 (-) comp24835_c0_seq1:207-1085(-)
MRSTLRFLLSCLLLCSFMCTVRFMSSIIEEVFHETRLVHLKAPNIMNRERTTEVFGAEDILSQTQFREFFGKLASNQIVHVKGWGSGKTCHEFNNDAWNVLKDVKVVVWDGDDYSKNMFTTLIERFVHNTDGVAVAFKVRSQLKSMEHSWRAVVEANPGKIKVVPVDLKSDCSTYSIDQSKYTGPEEARQYFQLGRIALKVSLSSRVVSMGGGQVAANELKAAVQAGEPQIRWTVYAASRKKKNRKPEEGVTACDFALEFSTKDKPQGCTAVVELMRGKDPDEALAFGTQKL